MGDADLREMLGVLALDNLLDVEQVEAPAEAQALLRERETARAERDWARADAIRDQLRELGWEVRDGADGPELLPALMIVYGRNAVHEAIRGPRTVSQVWATSNAGARAVARCRRDPARRSRPATRSHGAAGSDGHQGICAEVSEYRYVEAEAAARARAGADRRA